MLRYDQIKASCSSRSITNEPAVFRKSPWWTERRPERKGSKPQPETRLNSVPVPMSTRCCHQQTLRHKGSIKRRSEERQCKAGQNRYVSVAPWPRPGAGGAGCQPGQTQQSYSLTASPASFRVAHLQPDRDCVCPRPHTFTKSTKSNQSSHRSLIKINPRDTGDAAFFNSAQLSMKTHIMFVIVYRSPGPYSEFLSEFSEFLSSLLLKTELLLVIS